MITRTMPVTAKDLKGDGVFSKGNIDIISSDSLLGNKLDSPFSKHLSNFSFDVTASSVGESLIEQGDLSSMLVALGATSDGSMGVDRLSALLSNRELASMKNTTFFNGASYDTRISQSVGKSGTTNPEALGKLLKGLASQVTLDGIVNIETSSYSGHVYDLSTTSTLYTVNGLITSNCGCKYQLLVEGI